MKNIIKAALCIAAVTALYTSASAAAAPAAVPYGESVIDGKKDECYNGFSPIKTEIASISNKGKTGAQAEVWLAWDYDGLNVYAEVHDNTPDLTGTESYYRDSVEIFIDEDHSKSDIKDNNDVQYRVVRDNSHDVGLSAKDNFTSAVNELAESYIVEVKLPWRDVIPADGMVMGFDFMVNDAENGERKTMMLWNSTTNTNYKSTLNYGEIKLIYGDNYKPWDKVRPLMIALDSMRVDCGDVHPEVVDGRTLIPMRALFERFGAGVVWNGEERTVYAIGSDKLIKLPIGSQTVYVDGEVKELDVPAMIINDRTMVPVRFIAETFGANVKYDEYVGAVIITTK